jgi:hypothetical protein
MAERNYWVQFCACSNLNLSPQILRKFDGVLRKGSEWTYGASVDFKTYEDARAFVDSLKKAVLTKSEIRESTRGLIVNEEFSWKGGTYVDGFVYLQNMNWLDSYFLD